MTDRIFYFLIIIFVASCGDDVVWPHAQYEAQLGDYSKIDQVEDRMRDIAKRWKLEISEKDRGQMAFLTQGKPALFVALYFDGDPILSVTNAGVGSKLRIRATDFGEMPLSDLEKLTQDVLKELGMLNLEFNRVEGSQGPS